MKFDLARLLTLYPKVLLLLKEIGSSMEKTVVFLEAPMSIKRVNSIFTFFIITLMMISSLGIVPVAYAHEDEPPTPEPSNSWFSVEEIGQGDAAGLVDVDNHFRADALVTLLAGVQAVAARQNILVVAAARPRDDGQWTAAPL